MKPDAKNHNPSPAYLRGLITKSGLTQREAAQKIGINERTLRFYLAATNSNGYRPAPYSIQFALEKLAN